MIMIIVVVAEAHALQMNFVIMGFVIVSMILLVSLDINAVKMVVYQALYVLVAVGQEQDLEQELVLVQEQEVLLDAGGF